MHWCRDTLVPCRGAKGVVRHAAHFQDRVLRLPHDREKKEEVIAKEEIAERLRRPRSVAETLEQVSLCVGVETLDRGRPDAASQSRDGLPTTAKLLLVLLLAVVQLTLAIFLEVLGFDLLWRGVRPEQDREKDQYREQNR